MTRKSRLSRVTITLPTALLQAADKLAKRLDRSRSWVVAEGLRKLVLSEAKDPSPAGGVGTGAGVHEPSPPVYAAKAVAEARSQHLATELALSPTERLRRAEDLSRLARAVHPRPRRQQIIGFDTYEDFYEWKKARLVRG